MQEENSLLKVVAKIHQEMLEAGELEVTFEEMNELVPEECYPKKTVAELKEFYRGARLRGALWIEGFRRTKPGVFYDIVNGTDPEQLKLVFKNLSDGIHARNTRLAGISQNNNEILGQMYMDFLETEFVGYKEVNE